MADTQHKTGWLLYTKDNTGPGIKSATANTQKLSKAVSQLPTGFQKASSAMLVASSASAQMGGKVASSVGRISELGALVAVGGPLGIGLAAIAGATLAGAKAYEVLTLETNNAEAAQRSLIKVFAASDKALADQRDVIRELESAYKAIGKTKEQLSREEKEYEIQRREAAINRLEDERQEMVFYARAGGFRNEKMNDQIQLQMRLIARAKDRLELSKKELELTNKLNKAKAGGGGGGISFDTDAMSAAYGDQLKAENAAQFQALADRFAADGAYARKKNELDESIAMHRQRQLEQTAQQEAAMLAQQQQIWAQAATGLASSMGNAFGTMINGSQDAGMAMTQALVSAAQSAVMAYASSAAAAAAFSQAGIPIIGPVLATAAAATIFGVVQGYLSSIPSASGGGGSSGTGGGYYSGGERIRNPHLQSFADGGVVQGYGLSDSVPIMAMPGERVLSREERQEYEGGKNNITINFSSIGPATSADVKKVYVQLEKELSKISASRSGGFR